MLRLQIGVDEQLSLNIENLLTPIDDLITDGLLKAHHARRSAARNGGADRIGHIQLMKPSAHHHHWFLSIATHLVLFDPVEARHRRTARWRPAETGRAGAGPVGPPPSTSSSGGARVPAASQLMNSQPDAREEQATAKGRP